MPMRPRSGKQRAVRHKKVVIELLVAWLLKRVDLTACGVNAREHRADRAILARRVHRLKDDQQRVCVAGVEDALEVVQLIDLISEHTL